MPRASIRSSIASGLVIGLGAMAIVACGRIGFGEVPTSNDGGGDGDGSVDARVVPAVPFVPFWQSGSRLRARLLVGADGGDPIFVGWRDTLRNTDCRPVIAVDGNERCMPLETRADRFFGDAACTTTRVAIRWARRRCGNDQYAFSVDANNQVRAFPLITEHGGTVYDSSGGGCLPVPANMIAAAYLVGAEVPATDFALSTYDNIELGDLVQLRRRFEDGAHASEPSLSISADGSSCGPALGPVGPAPCVPAGTRVEAAYSDSSCTQRAFHWARTPGEAEPPARLVVEEPRACGRATTAYSITASISSSTFYVKEQGVCSGRTLDPEQRLYRGTPEPRTFPEGTMALTVDRGRVGMLVWTALDDQVSMPISAFDRETGLPCRHFVASDGVLRCLPRQPREVKASLDASCAIAEIVVASCFGAAPMAGPGYASCEDIHPVISALPRVGDSAWRASETGCEALEVPGGAHASIGGATVVPSTFPELMEIVE